MYKLGRSRYLNSSLQAEVRDWIKGKVRFLIFWIHFKLYLSHFFKLFQSDMKKTKVKGLSTSLENDVDISFDFHAQDWSFFSRHYELFRGGPLK